MHNYWLKQYGLAGAYVALPIAPENFEACVAALPLMGFAGANVTVPHKESAFALAGVLDDDARITGAVNTLIFESGAVTGLNTDVKGFAASLAAGLGEAAASAGPVAVLGAGGAARAVVLALARAGAPEIRLVNRTKTRSQALAKTLGQFAKIKLVDWGDWDAAFAGARLLVNTTSLGMTGKPPLELSLDRLPRKPRLPTSFTIRWKRHCSENCACPRSPDHGRAGHADASGGARLCRLVRRDAGGHRRAPRGTRESASSCLKSKGRKPLMIGLTGSIGMGKTETAKLFARLGIPVHGADEVVHQLYDKDGAAVDAIAREFPGTVRDGRVDREALAANVAGDEPAFRRLEAIVHPLVREAELEFLDDAMKRGDDLVVLDIPLLFETGGEKRMDAVVVVSAPPDVQRERVLSRAGHDARKARSHPRTPNSGCGQAQESRFRH